MGKYFVMPLEETSIIKIIEIKAISERGALQKFYATYKIRGKIKRFRKMRYR